MYNETLFPINSAFIEALNSQQSLRTQIEHLKTAIDSYQFQQCFGHPLQRHMSHGYLPSSTFLNRERLRRQKILLDLHSSDPYLSYIDDPYYSHPRPYFKFIDQQINFRTDLNLTQRQLQIQNHLRNLQQLRDDHCDRKNNDIDVRMGFDGVLQQSGRSTNSSINDYSRSRKVQYSNCSSSSSKSDQVSNSKRKKNSSRASNELKSSKNKQQRSPTKYYTSSTHKSKPKERKSQAVSKWMYIRDLEQLQKKMQQKRKSKGRSLNLNQQAESSERSFLQHKLSQEQKTSNGNLNKSIGCQLYNSRRPQILPKSHQAKILQNIKNRVKVSTCTFNKLSHATLLKNSQQLHKRYRAEESKRKACRQQLFAFVNRQNKKYASPFFVKQRS